jgi:hypothetical protein
MKQKIALKERKKLKMQINGKLNDIIELMKINTKLSL